VEYVFLLFIIFFHTKEALVNPSSSLIPKYEFVPLKTRYSFVCALPFEYVMIGKFVSADTHKQTRQRIKMGSFILFDGFDCDFNSLVSGFAIIKKFFGNRNVKLVLAFNLYIGGTFSTLNHLLAHFNNVSNHFIFHIPDFNTIHLLVPLKN